VHELKTQESPSISANVWQRSAYLETLYPLENLCLITCNQSCACHVILYEEWRQSVQATGCALGSRKFDSRQGFSASHPSRSVL